jgi:ankyrin repeat protein
MKILARSLTEEEKQIAVLSIFETFEEGKLNEFIDLKTKCNIADNEIIIKKDIDQRTGLHLVCKKGNLEFFEYLLPFYKSNPGSIDFLDEKQDTALSLASSHGYSKELDLEASENDSEQNDIEIENFLAIKGSMIKQLLTPDKNGVKADIRKSFIPKKNSPLHWAFYYGNYEGGMAIYNEYPLSILFKNNDKETPLEIIFQKNLKKQFKNRSKLLAKHILENFVKALFDGDTKFIFKNASDKEKKKFQDIVSHKVSKLSSDVQTVINKIIFHENREEVAKVIEKNNKILTKIRTHELGEVDPDNTIIGENHVDKKSKNKIGMHELNDVFHKSPDPELVKDQNAEVYQTSEQRALIDKRSENIRKGGIESNKRVETSMNDSGDFNENDKEDYAPINEVIEIYDEFDNLVRKNKEVKFLHKIFTICVHLNNVRLTRLLIENFRVSPFVTSISKHSSLYYVAAKGRANLLRFLINLNYKYYNSKREFNLANCLNQPQSFNLETPLHAACRFARKECYEILVDHGSNTELFNYYNWQPIELTRDKDIIELSEIHTKELDKKRIEDKSLAEANYYNEANLYSIDSKFQYLIIAKDTEKNYEKTLVYKQLLEIQNRYGNEDFIVEKMNPFHSAAGKFTRFYFLIKLSDNLMDQTADQLNLRIYNFHNQYIESFLKSKAKNYERFRDFHIHQIILYIINSEFNIEMFKKRGIIEDHFPIHKFKALKNIKEKYQGVKFSNNLQILSKSTKPLDSRHVNSIAFYYGCPYGFYMGFAGIYVPWLMILGIIGAAFTLKSLIRKEPFDNLLTPIYALIISLWVTIVYERWKQREKELTFMWNTMKFKIHETQRIDYIGHYAIDKASKSITEKKPNHIFFKLLV